MRTTGAPAVVTLLASGWLGLACAGPDRGASQAVVHTAGELESAGGAESPDPPAAEGAFAPRLGLDRGEPLLSWLEPVGDGHRLRFARYGVQGWTTPSTVAEGANFFANWADTPGIVRTHSGDLRAHWLQKTSEETYSYSIALARSVDGGVNWTRKGFLNEDETMTEHGFVSSALDRDGDLVTVWLDGREMVDGGSMELRSARGAGASVVLDDRVCECCSTDAAWAEDEVVVVYRDRGPDEVRDISVVRSTESGWDEPTTLHADGWRIEGCPVNGPAVAAAGRAVAVAWFTASNDTARVSVALSEDGGRTFSDPVVLDDDAPIGRVDVTWVESDVAVSWLGRDGEAGVLYVQLVDREGSAGDRIAVARTAATRATGVPGLTSHGLTLYVSWVDTDAEARSGDGSGRLRFRVLALGDRS